MALFSSSETSSRNHSLIPSFLYSSSSSTVHVAASSSSSSSPPSPKSNYKMVIPSPSEPAAGGGSNSIKMFTPAYYAACAVGGSLCCGVTHMAVTPLDLVKCNMQVMIFSHSLPISPLSFEEDVLF